MSSLSKPVFLVLNVLIQMQSLLGIAFAASIYIASSLFAFAQSESTASNIDYSVLFQSESSKSLYEIGEIRFSGNTAYRSEELDLVIYSKPTILNSAHAFIRYQHKNFEQIDSSSYLPGFVKQVIMPQLKYQIDRMSDEISYFNERSAENDVLALEEFYKQNGYHDAKVFFTFLPDTTLKLNILTFNINEGNVYHINSITYRGFEDVHPKVLSKIHTKIRIPQGDRFQESKVIEEVKNIHRVLKENGYYYAGFKIPEVVIDTSNYIDSLIIQFEPGIRQRIEKIIFVDSLKGQKKVTDAMLKEQITFSVGDWYSYKQFEKSINNLYALGVFEIASIDTMRGQKGTTDSTMIVEVFTQYKKQEDIGIGLYVNQWAEVNTLNAGTEVSYQHKNILGIAQSINLFVKGEVLNIDFTNIDASEAQFQGGIRFAQPLIFNIDNWQFGASGQITYSLQRINQALQLNTLSIPIRFPVRLPPFTFFQNASIFFPLIERQSPIDYLLFYDSLLIESTITDEVLSRAMRMYSNLHNYTKSNPGFFEPTSFSAGLNFIGDTRDNPFDPTSGYYFNLSVDGYLPYAIAKYLRTHFVTYFFTEISPTTILGMKLRAGNILWWDRDKSYVPFERQFFAGGANSNRGFQARRLRYPSPNSELYPQGAATTFIQDFIGSGSIIESTVEFRFKLGRFRNLSQAVNMLLQSMVFTLFTDIGNTYNWFADPKEYNIKDYLSNMAIASGLGIGYVTPVGPVRLEAALPIYNPGKAEENWIFEEEYIGINDFVFHISLGYSF